MEIPFLGFGLGLRTQHFQDVIDTRPAVDWFEVLTENFMVPGGKPKYFLHRIREHYPIVMHGVSLNIGSTDPLDYDYLRKLKVLVKEIEPKWISDHLCWTGVHGINTHDLLPLPYCKQVIRHIVERIQMVQEFLGRQILLENLSSYLTFKDSTLTEWEFVSEIAEQADCNLLLDINNIYVSATNHQFDPLDYLFNIPKQRVYQFHLAGHTNCGNHLIDTHDHDIVEPVWQLYKEACQQFGWVSTMIERDDNIPNLNTLVAELDKARHIAHNVLRVDDQHLVKTLT